MTDRTDHFHLIRRAIRTADEALDAAMRADLTEDQQQKQLQVVDATLILALRRVLDMRDAPARDHGEPVVTEERGPDGEWTTNADYTGGGR